MKSSALLGCTFVVAMAAGAFAADTFTVKPVVVQQPTLANPVAIVEIRGTLSNTMNNLGLALFAYDLRVTKSNPVAGDVDLSTAATFEPALPAVQPDVTSFHQPDGFSMVVNNVDLFNGSPNLLELEQLGGGQNTIDNDPLVTGIPFPSAAVVENVGHTEIVLHRFSLNVPIPPDTANDTYEVQPFNVIANMMASFNGTLYSVVAASTMVDTSMATIQFVQGCADPVPGDPAVAQATGAPAETTPCTSYIDPRIESTLGASPDQGITEVTMVFTEDVFKVGGGTPDASSFTVTETGGGTPPSVIGVVQNAANSYTVQLSRPITLRQWTTIVANVEDTCGNPITSNGDMGAGVAEPDRVDVAALPGDINQNGSTLPEDLIAFRQFLSSGIAPNPCVDELYYDIDRDGSILPSDLIRFRQILAGTVPATQTWLSVNLLSTQP